VSEIWIDKKDQQALENLVNSENVIPETSKTRELIAGLSDHKRSDYLTDLLDSIEFQIKQSDATFSYRDFTEQTFGFVIDRVTEDEIYDIQHSIQVLENQLNTTRQQIYAKHRLSTDEYKDFFLNSVNKVKTKLPTTITNFIDHGFEFELVGQKPWSAFNSHIAPFTSRLTLNRDIPFTKLDLFRLASHEAYGGHHAELSHKDTLLLNEGKGEHGIIVTFSPQTFVSEAIAEGVFVLLGILDKNDPEQIIGWQYDRLTFALQNLATYLHFDDSLSKDEIDRRLSQFAVSDATRKIVVGFSTDPVFGKYAPVYYTAFNFLERLYADTLEKELLIKTLFTQPCTPTMLLEQFNQ
jgi:hypothetical protein